MKQEAPTSTSGGSSPKDNVFDVDLSMLIFSNFSSVTPATREKLFEAQLEFLKESGFELIQKNKNYYFLDSDKNRKKITSLLRNEFGAYAFDFSCRENIFEHEKKFVLRGVSFRIKPEKLLLYENNRENLIEENKNEDTYRSLIDDVTKFLNSSEGITPEYTDVSISYNLYEMKKFFIDICKLLEYDTSISLEMKKKKEELESKREELKILKEDIKKYISIEDFSKKYPIMINQFEKNCIEKLGFLVERFYISPYNKIQATLKYLTEDYSYWIPLEKSNEEAVVLSDKETKEKFDTIGESKEYCNLFLTGTQKNFDKIGMELINWIGGVELNNIELEVKNWIPVIKTIDISISTLEKLI